jgi:hypothetical protein
MKLLALCLPVALLALAAPTVAREGTRKTIRDYYLALEPDARFGPWAQTEKERLDQLAELDVRRGYLRLRERASESAEMKLFRLSDGTPLLAQAHTGCCCGGACVRAIRFLADRQGKLEDVTMAIWPEIGVKERHEVIEQRLPPKDRWQADRLADTAVYKLPRTQAVVLIEADGHVYLRFRLKGDKFVRF